MTCEARSINGFILTMLTVILSGAYSNQALGADGDITSTAPDASVSPAVIDTYQSSGSNYYTFRGNVDQPYSNRVVKIHVTINSAAGGGDFFTIQPIDAFTGGYMYTTSLYTLGPGTITFNPVNSSGVTVGQQTTFPVNVTP